MSVPTMPSSEALLEELRSWVEIETPTTDPAAVNRLPGHDGYGDTLIARTNTGTGNAPILISGHVDTVWDHGHLTTDMPFRIDGERAYGPGIFDMKAGSFLAFHAVRTILAQGLTTNRPITLLLTPDEEVGSPTSRAIIEAEAARAAAVLIPEPAGGPDGCCVTARKGVGRFSLRVKGRSAHAGGNWTEGRSAVVKLAEKILAIHAMTDLDAAITTNVAPIWGGSRANVIPPEAGCEIDLRVANIEDGARMEVAMRALAEEADGISVTITGGKNRPPMAESADILHLYGIARGLAAEHGYTLPKQHRGGGSDGNFTAAMGIPTLDGLGCTGHGAHAPDEHIRWRDLAPRGATILGLLRGL